MYDVIEGGGGGGEVSVGVFHRSEEEVPPLCILLGPGPMDHAKSHGG